MALADGIIFDLDGTLYQDGAAIDGAVALIERLRSAGVPMRFATNTTRRPSKAIVALLSELGFHIERQELITAPVAAAAWLRRHSITRIFPLLDRSVWEDLPEFDLTGDRPEAVVVGDLGSSWHYDLLNTAFRHLIGGARLVAIQKNRYWMSESGMSLDAGGFVACLEYAAATTATIVGKPSAEFFNEAAGSMGLDIARVAVVGDDIEGDVGGAQASGAIGVLVRTGKYRRQLVEASGIAPDRTLDSVADLWPQLMGR